MKFILLFGPQAVGKMTVGQKLEKITGLKLFHNHMTIDLVAPFFSYEKKQAKRLVNLFREEIFKEVAQSDLKGMIFTYVWAFDLKEDWEYVEDICEIFKKEGGEIYFVELEADLDERLERNRHEHRLAHKPTKRDVDWTEGELKSCAKDHRLNSHEGEIKEQNYLRINNTNLNPEEVARKIQEHFDL